MDWPLIYTLCFIRRRDELLLLNRKKSPNLGMWNGVGGKIERTEAPRQCIMREVFEETGIASDTLTFHDRGVVRWHVQTDDERGGMYVFIANAPDNFMYETPVLCNEGILDWKPLTWILDPENQGVAETIPYFLPNILEAGQPHCHTFHFAPEKEPSCTYEMHDLHQDTHV